MVAEIAVHRPHEFTSIRHLGCSSGSRCCAKANASPDGVQPMQAGAPRDAIVKRRAGSPSVRREGRTR
jgi:hypothetical protein